jgi:glycosyltransferase involved in cell wall biosynthesis
MNDTRNYRLNAICLVKNEDDIIAQTLIHASQYCDKIFVLDNGSTDSTWEIVQTLSRKNEAIVPLKQILTPFSREHRGIVYHEVGHEMAEDDWWLVLDGDEFLAENPQPVIEQAVKEGADLIRTWQVQFYFTEVDLRQWEEGKDSRDKSVFDRRRYYLINWQEKRLFRNKKGLIWGNHIAPQGLHGVCRRRIMNRHYAFRDPDQIQKRLMVRFGHPSCFRHVKSTDWTSVLRDSRKLIYHQYGEPWRFKFSGLYYYYRRRFMRRARKKIKRAINWVR